MLSSGDLERLIMVKRREIETEKMVLGLTSSDNNTTENKENASKPAKKVSYGPSRVLSERNDSSHDDTTQRDGQETPPHLEEDIPADLERYIRRYVGLPVMLKAGEYSPNNPLIRGERSTGDALVGLGEYERRRNTLRKIRQRQYREYLDQQAKIKQEAKEKAERERREREERERLLEERERERQRELERHSPERRRASVNYTHVSGANNAYTTKVDTGVQVNNISKPLSVAVQTDDDELFRLTPSPKNLLTQAERELSPRMVIDSRDDRPIHPASWAARDQWKDWKDQEKDTKDRGLTWKEQDSDWQDKGDWKDHGKDWQQLRKELENKDRDWKEEKDWKDNKEWERRGERGGYKEERRRSYGDFDERSKRASRDREAGKTEIRHTYKPSIFDADAIELRNLQAEKEAAARRQFYQQELKNQILEQQRIREERKTREKMLEQAEMRRLEQQLRSLRAAQEQEVDRHNELDTTIRDDANNYERTRNKLQKEIDLEHQVLLRATSNVKRVTQTSKSDTFPSKLPFYYPRVVEKTARSLDPKEQRPPYSTNIPDNSIFSPNYDVDSYLRRNLNPTRESLSSNRLDTKDKYTKDVEIRRKVEPDDNRNVIIEKALVHDRPKPAERKIDRPKTLERHKITNSKIEPNIDVQVADPLPIPVLRHSPKRRTVSEQERSDLSEAMQMVDDKWKVPVVQKNILKSMPNEEGKNVSILTQLGSIRRQLQLEQLKLDKMLSKDSDV